jgi:hypothetical protein
MVGICAVKVAVVWYADGVHISKYCVVFTDANNGTDSLYGFPYPVIVSIEINTEEPDVGDRHHLCSHPMQVEDIRI